VGRGIRQSGRQAARTAVRHDLGARIRERREQLALTQVQIGAPGYGGPYVSAVEAGRHLPSLEALLLVAQNLGMTVGELLGETPEPTTAGSVLARALTRIRAELPRATGDRHSALTTIEFVLLHALPLIADRPDKN